MYTGEYSDVEVVQGESVEVEGGKGGCVEGERGEGEGGRELLSVSSEQDSISLCGVRGERGYQEEEEEEDGGDLMRRSRNKRRRSGERIQILYYSGKFNKLLPRNELIFF